MRKKSSGLVIVIWFIVFWPVGIYLLLKNLSNGRMESSNKAKIHLGIGVFLFIFAIAMLSQVISGEVSVSTGLSGFCFYFVGAVAMIYSSKKIKMWQKRAKQFTQIIINQQEKNLDKIAQSMGIGTDEAQAGIQKMIDQGYFADAYIDNMTKEIVFVDLKEQMRPDLETTKRSIGVKCPSCGAPNLIVEGLGAQNICEYCKTYID